MKIRAITSFFDPSFAEDRKNLKRISRCSAELAAALTSIGYTVQSQRLATSPFPKWLANSPAAVRLKQITALAENATELGWQYISVGPALPNEITDFELIPDILSAHPGVFAAGVIAQQGMLYLPAVKACANVIVNCAKLTTDGFTNLRYAALCNVKPYAPFLPAAFAEPDQPPALALAIECADEAVNAFSQAGSLHEGRNQFLTALGSHAKRMVGICSNVCARYSITFKGFDFSPAPYPEEWCSLGNALELLGVPKLGGFGSLSAAAFLASALDEGEWLKTGFNGLMLAVLEDSTLAKRAAEGTLSIKDLLLYSAVCGTGLDTIPLPGNTNIEEIVPLLMDLGALSIRLNKPLTGRLMPIPGKQAGDETSFDFEFFAKSRVLPVDSLPVNEPLITAEKIAIQSRNSN